VALLNLVLRTGSWHVSTRFMFYSFPVLFFFQVNRCILVLSSSNSLPSYGAITPLTLEFRSSRNLLRAQTLEFTRSMVVDVTTIVFILFFFCYERLRLSNNYCYRIRKPNSVSMIFNVLMLGVLVVSCSKIDNYF